MSASSHSLARWASLAALVSGVALGACNDDRAVLTDPFGPPAYGFALARAAINVPRGTVTFQRPLGAGPPVNDTSVSVTLAGLDSLTTGTYRVWIADVDPATDTIANIIPAVGRLTVTRTDTSINEQGDPVPSEVVTTFDNVTGFTNGGPATTVNFRATSTANGGVDVYLKTIVFVSIEADPAAAAPGSIRPFWARRASTSPVVTGTTSQDSVVRRTTPAVFGNFRADPDSQYVFNPTGRGLASVFGSIFLASDSGLARPPQGYYYAGSLIRRDSATNAVTDTVRLGPLLAPFPRYASLRDADESLVDPVVQDPKLPGVPRSPLITAGVHRLSADTVSTLSGPLPFKNVAEYRLTLEAKAGRDDVESPSVIVSANTPDVVRFGKQAP